MRARTIGCRSSCARRDRCHRPSASAASTALPAGTSHLLATAETLAEGPEGARLIRAGTRRARGGGQAQGRTSPVPPRLSPGQGQAHPRLPCKGGSSHGGRRARATRLGGKRVPSRSAGAPPDTGRRAASCEGSEPGRPSDRGPPPLFNPSVRCTAPKAREAREGSRSPMTVKCQRQRTPRGVLRRLPAPLTVSWSRPP